MLAVQHTGNLIEPTGQYSYSDWHVLPDTQQLLGKCVVNVSIMAVKLRSLVVDANVTINNTSQPAIEPYGINLPLFWCLSLLVFTHWAALAHVPVTLEDLSVLTN